MKYLKERLRDQGKQLEQGDYAVLARVAQAARDGFRNARAAVKRERLIWEELASVAAAYRRDRYCI